MTPLKTDFTKNGFRLRQIRRTQNTAVYEQSKDGRVHAYEVIRVRRHDGYTIAGRYMPPAEFYPSNEQWGVHGWTYLKQADAERKFREIRDLRMMQEIPMRWKDEIEVAVEIALSDLEIVPVEDAA